MRWLLLVLLLTGCVTTKPTVEIVSFPVPVPCVERAPERPGFVSSVELRAMSDYQFVLALWRDRLQRMGYEAEIEAVITACLP